MGGGLNAAFIVVMNKLYSYLAVALNNWENHRTKTAYEDALIMKTFLFQFVNSYIALFYIAFIKAGQVRRPAHSARQAAARRARCRAPSPLRLPLAMLRTPPDQRPSAKAKAMPL